MAKTVPNFGQLFHAAAQGFKWAPEFRLFVRVSPAGGFYKVEIKPPTYEPEPMMFGAQYTPAAWHGQEGILGYATAINKYMGRATGHTFYMDSDGEELPPQNIVEAVPKTDLHVKQVEPAPAKAAAPKITKNESEGVPAEFKGSK